MYLKMYMNNGCFRQIQHILAEWRIYVSVS